jgi:hypothetical protein
MEVQRTWIRKDTRIHTGAVHQRDQSTDGDGSVERYSLNFVQMQNEKV